MSRLEFVATVLTFIQKISTAYVIISISSIDNLPAASACCIWFIPIYMYMYICLILFNRIVFYCLLVYSKTISFRLLCIVCGKRHLNFMLTRVRLIWHWYQEPRFNLYLFLNDLITLNRLPAKVYVTENDNFLWNNRLEFSVASRLMLLLPFLFLSWDAGL